MLRDHDAGLVIGDPALQVDRSQYVTLDLAEEWNRQTGKSFVFAFWAVRKKALRDAADGARLAAIFQMSRDHGLRPENLTAIARQWAPELKLTERDVIKYLTQNIHFDLDSQCLEGLQLYYRYAAEIGVLPSVLTCTLPTPSLLRPATSEVTHSNNSCGDHGIFRFNKTMNSALIVSTPFAKVGDPL